MDPATLPAVKSSPRPSLCMAQDQARDHALENRFRRKEVKSLATALVASEVLPASLPHQGFA